MSAPSFDPIFNAQFEELLAWRRDVRHFDTRPLEQGVIEALLDLASLAPSVGNSQPWRFVRVITPELRNSVIAHVDRENMYAAKMYQSDAKVAYTKLKLHGLGEAPEHIAVFCDPSPKEGAGLGRQTMPETLVYSTVLAIHTLWLAARVRGIGLGWVSILNPAIFGELLDVPRDWQFVGYLCFGYPIDDNAIPELERSGWQPRIGAKVTTFVR
jgi:5,6-dimethylbenzimidazole synthase